MNMNKGSLLYLLILAMLAAVGAYEAMFPLPALMAFSRFFALSGFLLICVSLMIGPLAVLWPKSFAILLEPRRAVGIAAFVFALVHVWLVVAITYGANLGALTSTLSNELGTIAALLLFILAVISSDYALKRIGPGLWKNVQRLNYLVFILVFAHFVLGPNSVSTVFGGQTFVNLAEVFALLMGVATVVLQFAGFLTKRQMEQRKGAETASK